MTSHHPLLLALTAIFCVAPALHAQTPAVSRPLHEAIAETVVDRFGGGAEIEVVVDVIDGPAAIDTRATVAPAPGARVGQPARFVVTTPGAPSSSALARVDVVAPYVVTTRALAADATLGAEDVQVQRGALRDVALQPLPTQTEVLASRTKRAVAAGEVLTRAALARPFAVRAGDTVTLTVRAGSVEVRGVGRAVSSGYVGDVVRILPPGRREPARGRIVAPAAVEILP